MEYPKDFINKIIQGDCLEIMKSIPDQSIDLVLTDPPYKLSQEYGTAIESDNLIAVASILKVLPEIGRVLKDGRFAVIFYDNRILPLLFEGLKGSGLVYKRQIFLYRRWGNAHKNFAWMSCTDPVILLVKGSGKPFFPSIKPKYKHDCYIKAHPEKESTGHPAQKPREITDDIIKGLSNINDIILDPFLGSGTTIIAAQELGRRWIGIEISEKYCEISRKRLQYTEKPLF